ncbi:SET domain-containing protein [Annulohypoxylon maeteangense]|uniref:SET domain-containing protein n=1 Tax=Annulohypoxylon maeteangense TaxID=1927788 RepID=UPI002007929C|nr:SET domain-containing protein [Annulohypoxylon maeteangense]KAI0886333.1 SET domain-containing protein [Annulohypoxylon maeteangense]
MELFPNFPSFISWAGILAILNLPFAIAQLLDPSICSSDSHKSLSGIHHGLPICPLPIDEDSVADTGSWVPWKRRPYCLEPFMQDDDVTGPQFCLYTFESFRGDQGLSVITTPVLAATMVDALDDSAVPLNLRNHPSNSLAAEGKRNLAFTIEDVPGKGKGLVAKRPIKKWDIVLVDHPALIAHMDIFDVLGSEIREEILEQALKQLPEEQREEVMALERSMGGEPIEDILKTNIFGVELGFEIPHLGLFPIASRINHDCRPNVFWRYSVRTLAVEVIALRDIEPGDEITQSYVPLGLSYQDRTDDLKNWGFTCTCALCAASAHSRTTSDKHRQQLQHIYYTLNEGASGRSNITSGAISSLAGEMESLVRDEGLEAQLLVYYGVVARAYMRVGELDAARRYVEMSEELWMRYAGQEEDYLAGMQQLRYELGERERMAVTDRKVGEA